MVGESQLLTVPGVDSDPIQPNGPVSAKAEVIKSVDRAINPAITPYLARLIQLAPLPAAINARNGSKTMATGFIPRAIVATTTPEIKWPRSASTIAMHTKPTIKASLCEPATKCIRTSGFITPIQAAETGLTPCALAR